MTSGGRAAAVLIRARRRRRTVEPARVRQACEVLAAELRSGATPHAAWEVAGERLPGSTPVVAAAATGGDLHAALDGLVGSIGPDARPLAMAWVVADRFGAPVADLLERVAAGMRDEETIRREVAAQLAGPRATSRLLAGLPVLGLPIGFGLGVDPLGFLLGSPFGVACLVAGAALTGLGMWWIGRLVSRAERLR